MGRASRKMSGEIIFRWAWAKRPRFGIDNSRRRPAEVEAAQRSFYGLVLLAVRPVRSVEVRARVRFPTANERVCTDGEDSV